MPVLGHHFTVACFALAPLYWLGGGPQATRPVQAAALALAALPIFLFARDRLGNEWPALAFGVAWLLSPSVQWLCWEAWHPETMALSVLAPAYLMASRQRWRWYWGSSSPRSPGRRTSPSPSSCSASCSPSVVSGASTWTMLVGVAWFLIAYGIVMPHFNGGANHAGSFYGRGRRLTDGDRADRRDRTPMLCSTASTATTPSATPGPPRPWAFTPAPVAAPAARRRAPVLRQRPDQPNFFYDIQFHYVAIILAVPGPGQRRGRRPTRAARSAAFRAVGAVAPPRWPRRSPGGCRRSVPVPQRATGR